MTSSISLWVFSTRWVISLPTHLRPLLLEKLSGSKYISLRDKESQVTVSMFYWGKTMTWVIELSVRMGMWKTLVKNRILCSFCSNLVMMVTLLNIVEKSFTLIGNTGFIAFYFYFICSLCSELHIQNQHLF